MEYQFCKRIKVEGSFSNSTESKSLVHIPQEIIENILFRLPVKPLCRFKSVSQTWNSSISNLKFHTQSVFSILRSLKNQFFRTITTERTSTEKFPVPWGESDSKVYVSNSCNGMVLICVGTCFYLFNPSTHYFAKVLTLNYMDNSRNRLASFMIQYYMIIGLYYDETITDYKAVVLIRHSLLRDYKESRTDVLVEASLKGKQWNHLNHTFKTSEDITVGPIVNGQLHWLVNEKIIRFHSVSKVFEELPSFQPPPNHAKNCKIVGIGILDGCLCVSRIYHENNVEIVAMKEYGMSDSWTPICTFSDEKFDRIYHRLNRILLPTKAVVNPLLLTKAGEILISVRNEICVYNLGKKSFEEYCLPKEGLSECTVSFVPNMDTPTGYYWNQTEHEDLGNTEDFERIKKFWGKIALVRSQLLRFR